MLTKITWLLRKRAREKHNNCVWSHNLPFCPFCLSFPISYAIFCFCFVLIQNNVILIGNMFFHVCDAMGRLIKKNLSYFHCAISTRCLSCRVEHDEIHSLKNLDLDNNTRIIEDEKSPSKRGVILWVPMPLVFLDFNKLNIPCYFSLSINLFVDQLYKLYFHVHNGNKLLFKSTCHSNDGILFDLPINLHNVHCNE